MKSMLMVLIIGLTGCLLTSCENLRKNGSATIDTLCFVDKPLTYSAKDTPATQRQIMEFDVKGSQLCGWK